MYIYIYIYRERERYIYTCIYIYIYIYIYVYDVLSKEVPQLRRQRSADKEVPRLCFYCRADKEVGSRLFCRSYACRASSAQPAHASRVRRTQASKG